MTEELEKLRDYIHNEKPALDTLEGVVCDIVVKNRSDREILIKLCIRSGVLQSFMQESAHDIIFINQCKTKLVNDHFFSENAAEKAIRYCEFLLANETEVALVPINNDGKWGFKDSKSGLIMIDCIFNYTDFFSGDLAAVWYNHKWGYIDHKANMIIENKYDIVGRFNKNIAWVGMRNGLEMEWFTINHNGHKFSLPIKFTSHNRYVKINDIKISDPNISGDRDFVGFEWQDDFGNPIEVEIASGWVQLVLAIKYQIKQFLVMEDFNMNKKGQLIYKAFGRPY